LVPGTKSFITDQDSPLKERWGGWYITGALAGEPSLGNATVDESAESRSTDGTAVTKLVALPRQFNASTYLSADSDAVAHLVLAHQTQMHNLITLTNYKTRLALYSHAQQAKSAPSTDGGTAADFGLPDGLRQQFERPAEQLLRYLLFANEAALPGLDRQKVIASSAFAREFAARGVRDPVGRSLRDFDLSTRIFRYPCSYLIYSDAFDALPEPAKGYVYRRLLEILSGQDKSEDFARLTPQDRRAVLEILLATKAGLPTEWTEFAKSNHLRLADVAVESGRRH
jgi:hypothetical protein